MDTYIRVIRGEFIMNDDMNTPKDDSTVDPMADQMKSEDADAVTPATPVSDEAEMDAEVVAEEGEAEAPVAPVAPVVEDKEGSDEEATA